MDNSHHHGVIPADWTALAMKMRSRIFLNTAACHVTSVVRWDHQTNRSREQRALDALILFIESFWV